MFKYYFFCFINVIVFRKMIKKPFFWFHLVFKNSKHIIMTENILPYKNEELLS